MARIAGCPLLLFVLILPCLAGCGRENAVVPSQPGEVDAATNNLVAYWLQFRDGEEPVLVTGPYAVLLIWNDEETTFYLYDNVRKKVHKTGDFDRFLQQLDRLPPRVSIQYLEKCTAPFAYAMPPAERQRLNEAVRKGNRQWAVDPIRESNRFITCTCARGSETRGLRFP